MCLSTVVESYESPCTMITDGWKSLGGDPKKPRVQMTINGKSEIPFDKWIKATNEHAKDGGGGFVKADDRTLYKPGFHAYSDEADLARVKGRYSGDYRRVFLRGILCSGTQDGWKVVVAQEMYVPSDPNGWPPMGGEEDAGTPPAPQDGGKGVKGLIDKISGKGGVKAMGITPGQA